MIVPTMTNKEIVKALLADISVLQRKIPHIEREADRFVIKTKKFPFIKAYDYVTPQTKNNWIIVLEKKSKKDTLYSLINWHYTKKGFRAAMVTPDLEVVFLNDHLFVRFDSRDHRKLPANPISRVKNFFEKNPLFIVERTGTINQEVSNVICKVDTGVILGLEVDSIIICNTYISHEMLREDQRLLAQSLKVEMDDFLASWGKKRTPFRKGD